MNFGKRLDSSLSKRKKRKSWAAELLGISRQQLNRIIQQDSQPRKAKEMAYAIGPHLDVDPVWLYSGQNAPKKKTELNAINICEGNDLNKTGKKILVPNDSNLIAFIINSSAFSPEINEGTIAIVNCDRRPEDGDFVIVRDTNDHILIRKIFYTANGFTLQTKSSSSEYNKETAEIIGSIDEFRIIL